MSNLAYDKNQQEQSNDSLTGKKIDADLEQENDQPDEQNQVTQGSQKGKKVDADLEQESDKPSEE